MPKHSFRKRTLRKKRVTKKQRPRSRFRKRLSRRRRKTRRSRSRFRKRLSRRGAGGAPKDKGFPNPIPDDLNTALTGDIDKFKMWFNNWLVKVEEDNNEREVQLRLYELAQRINIALSVASLTSNPRYPVLEEPLEEKYNVVNKEFMGRGGNALIEDQDFKDIKTHADVSIAEHKQMIEKNAYKNVVPKGMKTTVSAQSFENWLERRLYQAVRLPQKLDTLYEIVPTIEAYIEETSGQPGPELMEKLEIAKNRLEKEKEKVPKNFLEKENTIQEKVKEKVLKEHKERMEKKKAERERMEKAREEEAEWEREVAAMIEKQNQGLRGRYGGPSYQQQVSEAERSGKGRPGRR